MRQHHALQILQRARSERLEPARRYHDRRIPSGIQLFRSGRHDAMNSRGRAVESLLVRRQAAIEMGERAPHSADTFAHQAVTSQCVHPYVVTIEDRSTGLRYRTDDVADRVPEVVEGERAVTTGEPQRLKERW